MRQHDTRPDGVLTRQEMSDPTTLERWHKLVLQMAQMLEGRKEPELVLTWLVARSMAAEVWRVDRETDDVEIVQHLNDADMLYHAQRSSLIRDLDERATVRKQLLKSIESLHGTYESITDAMDTSAATVAPKLTRVK